jgi:SAM-dependent methyltransferase
VLRDRPRDLGAEGAADGARHGGVAARRRVRRRRANNKLTRLRAHATPNVRFTDGFIEAEELLALYRRASVYVQVSAHEGFGLAAAEAMACECVVVGARGHALEEVVGDTGELVDYDDAAATAAAIERALANRDAGRRARGRIVERFDIARRATSLTDAMRALAMRSAEPGVNVDLGCGENKRLGYIGVDKRATRAADVVADARDTPFEQGSVDRVSATCLLEHFENPYEVLDEVVRILKPGGTAVFRLPNLGTYSAHLDTDHKFLADLKLWRTIFSGYFDDVRVKPLGAKYRDNLVLAGLTLIAIRGFRFYELAQGWDFVCTGPRREPEHRYTGWWAEEHQA